jgi:hypothetical protein
MMDQNEPKFLDPKEALRQIAEKTKSFRGTRIISLLMEISCYLLFIGFITLAIYLPDYLEIKLDAIEEEIGFYTLDPEDRPYWKTVLQIGLILLSLFPLVSGILFRRMARRNRVLSSIHAIATK